MGVIVFLAVTVIGGILFIINGASVLLGDCAAVTFDDSRRLTGRSFLIRATCLDEQQASSSDIPTWMGGWGLIIVGLLSVTAFFWLLPILASFAQRKERKRIEREELMLMNRASYQERWEAFYYAEESRLADRRQAAAAQKGMDSQTFVRSATSRCKMLRIGTIFSASVSVVVSIWALSAVNPMLAISALVIFAVSVGMMIWALVLKARYIGKAVRVKPDIAYPWIAITFGGMFALGSLSLIITA